MPPHDMFFWAAFFFLLGTLVGSCTLPFHGLASRTGFIGATAVTAVVVLRLLGMRRISPYAAFVVIGAAYCLFYGAHRFPEPIAFGHMGNIRGLVMRAEHHLDHQELSLGNGLRIYADRYPEFEYGDTIALRGEAKRSKNPLMAGIVNARHATIRLESEGGGYAIQRRLLAAKAAFENNLKRVLPSDQAAFLAGLTLGTTDEFSKEFVDELRASGTTHIVALSGSNVTGIIAGIMFLLGLVLPRRKIFWPTILAIALFVAMTGAESSLVRAAIMNGIVLAARRYERAGSMRNAIVAAALMMALWNPLVPAFDLGFQLSFAAILGMAYIMPILERYSPWKNRTLLESVSAQAAVMPLLAIAVGRTAPFAIIPNMLIAAAVPYTVTLGFLTGGTALVSGTLAFAPAWLAGILLSYEMEVIHIAARYL